MADLATIEEIRRFIGDMPKIEFNEVVSDGVNASWRPTNSPVQHASEDIYVSGVIQQTLAQTGILKADVAVGDYTLNLGDDAALYAVGELVCLENSVAPRKFEITSISDGVLTLNRRVEAAVANGSYAYRSTRSGYTIDYANGIVYFAAVQLPSATLGANFVHTKYSDDFLSSLLSDAELIVGSDVGGSASIGSNTQRQLVLLKLKELVLGNEINESASSAISIKQGSTSLDLSGSNRALTRERDALFEAYQIALARYIMNEADGFLGSAVVGRDGYLD